jgi:hypothetical protein
MRKRNQITQYERNIINKHWRSMGYYAQAKVIRRKFFMPGGAPYWINQIIDGRFYLITEQEYLKIKQYYELLNNR